jgi:hypothetical protein
MTDKKKTMKQLHTICYTSISDPLLGRGDIRALFDQVTRTNNALQMTGILLYSFGRFLQVLEGDRDQVVGMFTQKILGDPRHTDIFEIFNRPSARPVFMDYSSRFTAVSTQVQLDRVRQYLGAHGPSPTSEKISRLILPFILFGGDHGGGAPSGDR